MNEPDSFELTGLLTARLAEFGGMDRGQALRLANILQPLILTAHNAALVRELNAIAVPPRGQYGTYMDRIAARIVALSKAGKEE